MVKAYTAAVKTSQEKLSRAERVVWISFLATFDYALVTPFGRRLAEFEAEILNMDYGERVDCRLRLPEECEDGFRKMFDDLSAGQGRLKLLD
jgi:putative IMPACT (imprinted ancient) family translation regulator